MNVNNSIRHFTKILIILLLVFNASYSYAAPAGYSTYIVPGDETSMAIIFDEAANDRILGNVGGITDSMYSAVGITSWTDNTQIYIDHWEDGYTFDPDDPVDTADEVCPVQSAGAFLNLGHGSLRHPESRARPLQSLGD